MEPIDPQVWSQPGMRQALAARDIGTVYRLLKRYGGLSQRRIAELTGTSQSQVSEILHGRRVLAYDTLERIADGLGVERGWLGLSYGADGAYAGEAKGQPSSTAEEVDEDVKRRMFLALTSAAVLGEAVVGELGRLPLAPDAPTPGRLGAPDVAAVRNLTAHYRALDHAHGGASIHEAISASAQRLSRMLGAQARPDVQRSLLEAMADQHRVAGWTAVDAGATDRARRHFTAALNLAGEADDRRQIALVIDAAGRMELLHGEPNEALKLFQLAAVERGQTAPALLHGTTASAYAALGERGHASRELGAARETAQGEGEGMATAVEGLAAHTLLALGDYGGAVAASQRTLRARAEDPGEARARCQETATMAAAHLRAGNFGEGVSAAGRSLALAEVLGSRTARDGLTPLREAAQQRRDSSCQDIAQRVRVLQSA